MKSIIAYVYHHSQRKKIHIGCPEPAFKKEARREAKPMK